MNSLNIANHAEHYNSATQHRKKDKISEFFEHHETTRKMVAYAPIIIFGGANTIERFSSYKLLPERSVPYMISLFVMFFFQGFAMSCERSLQDKKIERLS
jgi:hypothetical protein